MMSFREFLTESGTYYRILESCNSYHFNRIQGWAKSVIFLENSGYVLENIYVIDTYDGGRDMIAVYKHEQDRDKILLCYTLPN